MFHVCQASVVSNPTLGMNTNDVKPVVPAECTSMLNVGSLVPLVRYVE